MPLALGCCLHRRTCRRTSQHKQLCCKYRVPRHLCLHFHSASPTRVDIWWWKKMRKKHVSNDVGFHVVADAVLSTLGTRVFWPFSWTCLQWMGLLLAIFTLCLEPASICLVRRIPVATGLKCLGFITEWGLCPRMRWHTSPPGAVGLQTSCLHSTGAATEPFCPGDRS